MAKIDKHGNWRGAIGNVVLRELNDKPIAQIKANQKQTKATKLSASEFGEANRTSKLIRNRLEPYISQWSDAEMHGRFTGQVFKAISSGTTGEVGQRTFADAPVGQLLGFEFNQHTPFEKYCNIIPEVTFADGRITIVVPEFIAKLDFRKLKEVEEIELGFAVAALSMDRTIDAALDSEYFPIKFKPAVDLFESTEFVSQEIPAQAYIFVLAMIMYKGRRTIRGENVLNSKRLNPCIVVGVFKS